MMLANTPKRNTRQAANCLSSPRTVECAPLYGPLTQALSTGLLPMPALLVLRDTTCLIYARPMRLA